MSSVSPPRGASVGSNGRRRPMSRERSSMSPSVRQSRPRMRQPRQNSFSDRSADRSPLGSDGGDDSSNVRPGRNMHPDRRIRNRTDDHPSDYDVGRMASPPSQRRRYMSRSPVENRDSRSNMGYNNQRPTKYGGPYGTQSSERGGPGNRYGNDYSGNRGRPPYSDGPRNFGAGRQGSRSPSSYNSYPPRPSGGDNRYGASGDNNDSRYAGGRSDNRYHNDSQRPQHHFNDGYRGRGGYNHSFDGRGTDNSPFGPRGGSGNMGGRPMGRAGNGHCDRTYDQHDDRPSYGYNRGGGGGPRNFVAHQRPPQSSYGGGRSSPPGPYNQNTGGPYGNNHGSGGGEGPHNRGGAGNRGRDEAPPAKPSKTLGIFGLNYETTEDDLDELFSRFGRIEDIRLIRDPNGNSRGFCFITFQHIDDAYAARDSMSEQKLHGRYIRVDFSLTQGPYNKQSFGGGNDNSQQNGPHHFNGHNNNRDGGGQNNWNNNRERGRFQDGKFSRMDQNYDRGGRTNYQQHYQHQGGNYQNRSYGGSNNYRGRDFHHARDYGNRGRGGYNSQYHQRRMSSRSVSPRGEGGSTVPMSSRIGTRRPLPRRNDREMSGSQRRSTSPRTDSRSRSRDSSVRSASPRSSAASPIRMQQNSTLNSQERANYSSTSASGTGGRSMDADEGDSASRQPSRYRELGQRV